jgi:hypothetical protein
MVAMWVFKINGCLYIKDARRAKKLRFSLKKSALTYRRKSSHQGAKAPRITKFIQLHRITAQSPLIDSWWWQISKHLNRPYPT